MISKLIQAVRKAWGAMAVLARPIPFEVRVRIDGSRKVLVHTAETFHEALDWCKQYTHVHAFATIWRGGQFVAARDIYPDRTQYGKRNPVDTAYAEAIQAGLCKGA